MNAGGRALDYACWGPPPAKAPTLVLLHEGLGCVALWRDFPRRLAEVTGFGVFAYSRAGYGQSDPEPLPWPLDYMTRHAQDVLPQVLDNIGFHSGAFIGHSDGASIALLHAGLVQDRRVKTLCCLAPHVFTEPEALAAIRDARAQYDTGDLKARLSKYHSAPDCAFRGWNDSWLHPDFAGWNIEHVLGHIEVPVLTIQGANDPYGTLRQVEAIDARVPDHARLILPKIGHAPHLDAMDDVLMTVAGATKDAL